MFILGFLLLCVGFGNCVRYFCDVDDGLRLILLGVAIILIGIPILVYDIASPTEITVEKTFYTSDYEKYGLNIDSDKIGIVKKIWKKGVYPLAIYNNGKFYYFVDFVNKENAIEGQKWIKYLEVGMKI